MRIPPGTLCKVMRGATLETSKACGKPAVRILTTSCAHEHTSTNIVCAEHALLLITRTDMLCQVCAGIDNHRCPRVVKENADG